MTEMFDGQNIAKSLFRPIQVVFLSRPICLLTTFTIDKVQSNRSDHIY